MKLTIKQSSIAMAVCTSLYLALRVAYEIPVAANFLYQCQLLPYLPQALLLIGIICMGLTLYFNAHQLPTLTKSLKWQAACLGVIMLGVLLYNFIPINSIQIHGFRYCYWHSSWLRIAMVTWLTAWLLQYAFMKSTETFRSKPMMVTSALIVFVAALILVLMVVSSIHVIMYDHVAGFRTGGWLSWLRPLIAIGFFGTYLYDEIINKKKFVAKVEDGHDNPTQLPDIQQYSKASRILAWATVGTLTFFIILAIIGACFDWLFSGGRFEDCFVVCLLGSVHMLWISSVIAMLTDKSTKKWLRILNILAPLFINGAIVLALFLEAFIPIDVINRLDTTLTVDIPIIGLVSCIVFVIAVWFTNTFVVIRTEWKAKRDEQTISCN